MSKKIPSEIGQVGLDYNSTGGVLEEYNSDLQWPEAGDVYKEMASDDPTIGAMLFAIEMLIRGVEWSTTPASDSSRHKQEAELLGSIIHDMDKPWNETIVDILSFLQYGFSIHEPVFKIRRGPLQKSPKFRSKHSDGKFGLRKLAIRSQGSIDGWDFDKKTGEVLGVWQCPPASSKRILITRDKYLHFRVNSKRDNPESTSILRNAHRPWYLKKFIEDQEATGIARDLSGIPVMTAPLSIMSSDASAAERKVRQDLENIVTRIAKNEQAGVILPAVIDPISNQNLVKLELLSNTGQRQHDTDAIITRYSSQIAQTVLADFIMLGQTTFGSFALSSNKTKLFSVALGAWLTSIADTLNKELVPKLAELNGWDSGDLPRISVGDLEGRDLEAVSNFFSKLAKEGLVRGDEPLEAFLREAAGAPSKDKASEYEIDTSDDSSSGDGDSAYSDVTDKGKPTGDAIA